MTTKPHGLDSDHPALLTLDEFIKTAGDRGKKLWVETRETGRQRITDGARRYALPSRLPGGRMPSGLVEALVDLFFDGDQLAVDFALDQRDD